jgi:uncharacterized protein (DUF1800 family)
LVVTARGKDAAALALHRFGFGPAGNAVATIAGDPRGALLADLERPQAGLLAANLPSSAEAARALAEFNAEQAARKKLEERTRKEAAAAEANNGSTVANVSALDCSKQAPCAAPSPQNLPEAMSAPPPLGQQLIQGEAKLRLDAAATATTGFAERLVWFWSNHFCVSADKTVAMAGPYEREAIRPYALGKFVDLLQAVESHPAMLFYLDNAGSMGADSVAGINRDKGLNENLAREILELHTLGVRSGYSQADVTSFANVLTGWTLIDAAVPAHGGEFVFFKRFHQPGAQTVLGKRYPDIGVEQGRAVLADLARHPATALHIAHKLARHFVADEPPPTLVAKLEAAFRSTEGDLKEVAKTLVTADESWAPQRGKLKQPDVWLIAMHRMAGVLPSSAVGQVLGAQASLGQALWRPPAPNGFPDMEAAWIDGVPRRLDIANAFARRVALNADPLALLEYGLGPAVSTATRDTVTRAESRVQALALLFMTPEFLRS